MLTRIIPFKRGAAALTFTALSLASGHSFAAEYWLRAGVTTVEMPNPNGVAPVSVAMWGYAKCTATFAACDPISVPGPALSVSSTETVLTVHLRNDLTVPTSMVINGLIKAMTPVWDNGAMGSRPNQAARVRSFDVEAAPNSGVADYTWNNVKPGTYLYQSGTQPQVQVQMGLYGAAKRNLVDATATAPGQAYAGVGYGFDNEATLIYSEIDPALHAAVAGGTYGTSAGPTSTVNYAPKYFLINGRPYQFGASSVEPVGNPGTTLLRLLNAGLTTHVPMIQGKHWDLISEDGKPYPYRRTQYTALLPAAKTVDVLLTPEVGVAYPIMDRRLSLSNNGLLDGGMLAFLRVGALGAISGSVAGNAAPVANPDSYSTVQGVLLNVTAQDGVLKNDTDVDTPVIKAMAASGMTTGVGAGGQKGTYTLNANGSFTYVPAPGFTGPTDTFQYVATDGKSLSSPATVTITLTVPQAPALGGALDTFENNGTSLGASWIQQVGTTTSVPDIGVAGGSAVANTTALGGLAIWNSPSGFGSNQAAGATLSGNAYLVLKASGGTVADGPANYVRIGCDAGQVVVSTMMGGSNVSTFVKQAAFGNCSASGNQLIAAVDAKGLVTVFQSATFIGGVQLPDVAVWKGGGRIGMQLTAAGSSADEFAGATIP